MAREFSSDDPADLDAGILRRAIAGGHLTPYRIVEACLRRIEAREPDVRAWAYLDPAAALRQAAELGANARDDQRPLLGVPIGIKDIFATADMPTENGTHLHAGRRPTHDAAAVERLRAAGAVIMGKTVTTEFAAFTPGQTRNPWDPQRTPGGSSSGSAAAVASGMVPLAIGSQTNGSVIRPASYCGVYGFKPSFGRIDRRGMTAQAPSVDHVGVFARSLADIALLADVLVDQEADEATTPFAPRAAFATAVSAAGRTEPRIAFVKGASWSDAEPSTQARFEALATRLGLPLLALPAPFDRAIEVHRQLTWPEIAAQFATEYALGPGALSDGLRAMVEGGRALSKTAHQDAVQDRLRLIESMAPLFAAYDAFLTPAAAGEAPLGLENTGSPIFCTPWTLLGAPALSLPLLEGPHGLPLGVQLVGKPGDDTRLLATAAWLGSVLADIH